MKASRRSDTLTILASIAASLALFACGGDREAQGVTPANDEPAQTTAKTPQPPATGAVAAPPAPGEPLSAPPAPTGDDGTNPWAFPGSSDAAHPEQTAELTFGGDGGELEEEAAPRKAAEPAPLPGGGHVFTNKDLNRYRAIGSFGRKDESEETPRKRSSGKESGEDAEDPNKPGDDKSLSPEEMQAQIDATQAEIAKAEEDLRYLKSRPASLHNPFLPRVQPNEEDAAKESGMDNVQRLEHVAARVSETEARINELRQKLESLRQTPPPNQ